MGALLTDLYQLTMLQAYLDEGMDEQATFELFVRKLPAGRNFLVAAGLEPALDFLETLAFGDDEIAWLDRQGSFPARLLDQLARLRFRGDVLAMPEGTVFFADEPILRVSAPLPQAQLVESRLLNIVHLHTLIASKAARVVLAAPGKRLVDFGMRRAHGAEAALAAARATWIAGFDGTATAAAGRRFGIPVFGTMAHSFVQAHANEAAAFEAFARARPDRPILLVDTYDTAVGIRRAAALGARLAREGIVLGGVRLDSGDLVADARLARRELDRAGLSGATVFASGNLDEWSVAGLIAAGAPIGGFGIGTAIDTSADAPSLDAVYKLQAYAGTPRRKRSPGKATWPGVKQVWRQRDAAGSIAADRVQLDHEPGSGEALLRPVMRSGKRLDADAMLDRARRRCAEELRGLPSRLRGLTDAQPAFGAEISPAIRALAEDLDRTAGAWTSELHADCARAIGHG